MAAVSSSVTEATGLTPPGSNHGQNGWDFSANENNERDKNAAVRIGHSLRSPLATQNGNAPAAYSQPSHRTNAAARRTHSSDNLNPGRWEQGGEKVGDAPPPAVINKPRYGSGSFSDRATHAQQHVTGERRRQPSQSGGEDSKWIHRDKLAKIESEEMQAAGLVMPIARVSSGPRRPRDQPSPVFDPPQNDDDAATQEPSVEEEALAVVPVWDLRTPEEIADAEESAYFAKQATKGGTRIPIAKVSPAPIPLGYLERTSPSRRRLDALGGDTIEYQKTRSRSASASITAKEAAVAANGGDGAAIHRRPAMDGSPKRSSKRNVSTASKSSTTASRPKTRSGSSGRPMTRSGESSAASRQPEGDPPWVFDSYKPDPRLPPDQQLLPTVARRLRQEQWAKEGKFGDTYDKEFRPLNDHEFRPPQERNSMALDEGPEEVKERPDEDEARQSGDWPLKPESAKSPKQSFYSTMPKISDTPLVSPVTSPKSPATLPAAPARNGSAVDTRTQVAREKAEQQEKTEKQQQQKEAGCACCVIM